MRLYAGTSRLFIEDAARNQIADKLSDSFRQHYGHRPSLSEVGSWRNSLRAMSTVLERGKLLDHGVILEYQLPLSSKRLDCLVCGVDEKRNPGAVIVELKQWVACAPSDAEKCVSTWLGGAEREVLHPSAQVQQYQRYLEDSQTAFYDGALPVGLHSCAYLHNYAATNTDPLFASKFDILRTESPTFTGADVDELTDFLVQPLRGGDGDAVLRTIEAGLPRPSKRLLDHVAAVIRGNPEFVLLDEQLVVFEKAVACTKRGFHDARKAVLLVQGGPGTGKSVIAINLLATLARAGYSAQYATGSRAFTETLRKKVGNRAEVQFKYFNSYGTAGENEIDVLICDEAHRLRATSVSRYTPRAERTDLPQIDEVLRAAKVSVFLIDDKQGVRPNEVGSSGLVREAAARANASLYEFELETQFRCAGSDSFVRWVWSAPQFPRHMESEG